ncbi:MAG: glycosyltransferase family 9 protein [bacterium]
MKNNRILILKGEGLSQFVEAEPVFATIRQKFPDAQLELLTSHALGKLAKGASYFDRVWAAGQFETAAARRNFLKELKRRNYTTVFDLDGTRLSAEIKKTLCGWRGADWVGPKKLINSGKIVNEFIPSFSGAAMRKLMHEHGLEVEERLPNVDFSLKGRKDAANMRPSWYGISGEFALLHPAREEEQRWPAEHYAQLASDLVMRGVTPVLVGTEEMTTFGNTVSQLMVQIGPKGGARALVDLTDKTDLAQLAALAKEASFFVAGIADEVYLTISLNCPGLLLLQQQEMANADALYGRRIVCMTAEDVATIDPESVTTMLISMGLLNENVKKDMAVSA